MIAAPAHAAEEILLFESDITVKEDGTLDVTETIKVRAERGQIRRGIYRDFPVRYRNEMGYRRTVGFDILEIKRDGADSEYHTESHGLDTRIYIGSKTVWIEPGVYTYTIRYETTRQLRFFKDYDEIYWNVTGSFWSFPIQHAVARIKLPQTAEILQTAGYTGYYGGRGADYRIAGQGFNTITFETTRSLRPFEGLTVAAAFTKGVIPEPGAFANLLHALWDNLGLIILVGGTFGVGIFFLGKWLEVGRDPMVGTIIPLFEPPQGLSPAAVSYLHYQRFKGKGTSSTKAFIAALLSLAVKGHLKLEDKGDKKVTLEAADRNVGNLPRGERAIWSKLLANRDKFTFEAKNASTVSSTQSSFKNAILAEYEGVFFKNNHMTFAIGAAFSVIVLVAFLVLQAPFEDEIGVAIVALISGLAGSVLLAMGLRRILGWLPGGGSMTLGVVLTVAGAIVITPALLMPAVAFGLFPVIIPVAIAILAIMNVAFFYLLRAPTVVGRKVMDDAEGFKMFLSVTEAERMNMAGAPDVSQPIFEKYLPYAVALGVEEPWSEAFASYLAKAAPQATYHPSWYHGDRFSTSRLASSTSNLVSSVGSSVSAAMPKSSGSSGSGGGGFSGGGGGGGGGGGW